jgi:hypothetical protein
MKYEKGISLLEILVVVSIFAVLGILITRSVLLTLGGGKKSESLIKVRENLNYSMSVIERQLRNANSITDCGNTDTSTISYLDQSGNAASFSCKNMGQAGSVGYIASGSAKLSSDTVNVTGCKFTCGLGTASPSSVTIDLTAIDASASGIENSSVTTKTQVFLRNY